MPTNSRSNAGMFLVDGLWLILLSLYVFAGVSLASFHGDEPMQLWMSNDYVTAFMERNPQALITHPPYESQSVEEMRLINGSVTRHAAGFAWHLAGYQPEDLPPYPGWRWYEDYDQNNAHGYVPDADLLYVGRLSSVAFQIGSVFLVFAFAFVLHGRGLAYFVSLFYTLNPVILLNGRRLMMESPLLFFGFLTLLLALIISRKQAQNQQAHLGWWLGLTVAAAFTVNSKHPGVIIVAVAWAWVTVSAVMAFRQHKNPMGLVQTLFKLDIAGIAAVALFFALSPALWSSPFERVMDMVEARSGLLDLQTAYQPNALSDRITLIANHYNRPLQHFEVDHWVGYPVVMAQVEAYDASFLSGLPMDNGSGIALSVIALVGLVSLFIPGGKLNLADRLGLLLWLALTLGMLLVNPLSWQRYFLPLMPITILFAGLGIFRITERLKPQSA